MRLSGCASALGHLESLFPKSTALSEHAQFGIAQGEAGIGEHGGQDDLPKCSWRRAPSKNATTCLKQAIAWR